MIIVFHAPQYTVNSLISNHPWCMTEWSLMGGGRLRELVTYGRWSLIGGSRLRELVTRRDLVSSKITVPYIQCSIIMTAFILGVNFTSKNCDYSFLRSYFMEDFVMEFKSNLQQKDRHFFLPPLLAAILFYCSYHVQLVMTSLINLISTNQHLKLVF